MRVVQVRTGVVLDRGGGALAKMLPPFRLGVGGPVAGGCQYISWIHPEDLRRDDARGACRRALGAGRSTRTAPEPRPQPRVLAERSVARSAVPRCCRCRALALRLLYGEMAEIVTTGARVMPAKALVLGYQFAHPQLEGALRSALTALAGTRLAIAAADSAVSMITRQGRLLSR